MKEYISNKRVVDFINSIAVLGESSIPGDDAKVWLSKMDGSFITRQGLHNDLKWMIKKGITDQIQSIDNYSVACIGFNPVEQKWYGWSHRASFGFGIGSKVKKGSCGYSPSCKAEFIQDNLKFWGDLDMDGDTYKTNPTAKVIMENGILGVYIEYKYNDEVPNKQMRNRLSGHFIPFPDKFGRGEWTAKTIEDAKQMATDFARSVG